MVVCVCDVLIKLLGGRIAIENAAVELEQSSEVSLQLTYLDISALATL